MVGAALVCGTLAGPSAAGAAPAAGAPPARPSAAGGHDTTSPAEARRVDGVATPHVRWQPCRESFECAHVALPADYDRPGGPLVKVGLLRSPATDPARRIGSLLINPGGPGGSGMDMAQVLTGMLAPEMRARFDLVGFDPRGVGESERLDCLPDDAARDKILAAYVAAPVPVTDAQRRSRTGAARAIAAGCAEAGRRTVAGMHTAQVARDMDVLRRALGDARLNYLGFSYGSILGQYYAAMFPDRFRALAIDGVVDSRDWIGVGGQRRRPVFDRIGSAPASERAVQEFLRRCRAAGAARCPLAGVGDPAAVYEDIAVRLRAKPVEVGGAPFGYQEFVQLAVMVAYAPEFLQQYDTALLGLYHLTHPADARTRAAASTALDALVRRTGLRDTPDFRGLEATYGVMCGDAGHTSDLRRWPALADDAARRAGHTGRLRAWQDDICAADVWAAPARDRYTGAPHRRTAAPVLVSGNTWDPATARENAFTVARELAGSYLLDTDAWGHLSYLASGCAREAIDAYLLTGARPPAAQCRDAWQPFQDRRAATPPAPFARTPLL
ncbi:peptidase [Pilimelia terevasa]|uniref:Peptidase n=1 Tax=Pilimelia terevasa TaxID=53372 RepID=A0A8J3BRL8_9ACTN|nr:peptidase [Pilimelia terevasa]